MRATVIGSGYVGLVTGACLSDLGFKVENFHNPDFQTMKLLMRHPYILDARNLYNPDALADIGIAYQGIGRRNDLVQVAAQTLPTSLQAVNA